MFENKKIFILGMARSGYECAKLLARRNNTIVVNDYSSQDENLVKELIDMKVNVIIGSHPDEIFTKDFDYLVKNPGIPNDHKYVEFAIKHQIPIINEIEVAYHLLPNDIKIIGITGTNGKTTTTTLIYEILKMANQPVYLGGNIGYPVSSLVDKVSSQDILVLEISDHQLFNMYDFKTNISVLTNLYEAHLDFHGNYENYKDKKKRIFNHHTKDDIAIINLNNNDSLELTKDIKSKKLFFSINEKADCWINENSIVFNDEKIVNLDNIRIKGNHNYENVMMSIIVAKLLGVKTSVIKAVLDDFVGVEHRLEFVARINDIEFYNDSKSTNNKSTQIALSSFSKPVILIMGGLDRGQSFTELKDYLGNVKTIISYGETKNNIKKFCDKYQVDCIITHDLQEATKCGYQIATKDDIVLLSPACASWDQFKDFEERGNLFKKIVEELKNK